jgi:hypothetical protein
MVCSLSALRRTNLDKLSIMMLAVVLFATSAQAETWYLMAPNEQQMSSSHEASVKKLGSVVGPIHFESRAEFPSRGQCEPARQKVIDDWRRASVMTLGSWNALGFNSASEFVRCVSSGDPRLVKSSARTAGQTHGPSDLSPGPSMDINIPIRARRR